MCVCVWLWVGVYVCDNSFMEKFLMKLNNFYNKKQNKKTNMVKLFDEGIVDLAGLKR